MTLQEVKKEIESRSNVKVKYLSRYLTTLECELNDKKCKYVGIMNVVKDENSNINIKFNFYHKETGKRMFAPAGFYYTPLKYSDDGYFFSIHRIISNTKYTDETKERFYEIVHEYFPKELIDYYGMILNGV